MLLTVSAKKLPPVTRLQAKTTARMRADVRPKILRMYNLHEKLLVLNASHVAYLGSKEADEKVDNVEAGGVSEAGPFPIYRGKKTSQDCLKSKPYLIERRYQRYVIIRM